MFDRKRFFGKAVFLIALALALVSNAFAIPVTWTLSGVTFSDGGTASGSFVFDADTNTLSNWNVSVAGGNTTTFPPATYSTASSSALYFSGAPTIVGAQFTLNGSSRQIRLPGVTALSNAGGTVALNIGSPAAAECFNCGPARAYTAGNLIGGSASVAPQITSANATTFTVGTAGTFTVTTTGVPNATLSESGALPNGVTFTDNGNGTATLAGTPAVGTGGTYTLTLTANNGVAPNATQTFTLTVNQAPGITSANATTFTVGTAGTFTVTTSGFPTNATLSESGALPNGVTFTNNGNGTATLAGTPAAGTGGTYTLTLTANNGVAPNATQTFTLTVNQAPAITSANATTFTVGAAGTFTVTTSGFPTNAALSQTGALPNGVTFTNNGNGTATLAGTPAAGTVGNYPLTFTANNGVSPNATQTFTLTVNQAPTITSPSTAYFVVGSPGSFTLTTTGTPTPAVSETGALPAGLTFVDNGNGTATLSGTAAVGTTGTYPLTITASNGAQPAATQTLNVLVYVPAAPAPTLTRGGLLLLLGALLAGTFLGLRRTRQRV